MIKNILFIHYSKSIGVSGLYFEFCMEQNLFWADRACGEGALEKTDRHIKKYPGLLFRTHVL